MSDLKKFQYFCTKEQQGDQSSWSRGRGRAVCRDPWQRDSWEPCCVGLAGLAGGGGCPLVGISWGAVGGPWVAEGQMFQQDHITLALH